MKMQLQKKDIKLIIVLVGVLILVVAYFVVYRNYDQQTQDLQSQIDSLQPELQQLREYDEHKQEYLDGTEAYKENMKSIMSSLPTSVWTEDQIMLARRMEEDLDITDTSESFADPIVVTQFKGTPLDDIDNYSDQVDMTSNKYQMTLAADMDYSQMKDFLDYVYDEDYMTGLDSITMNYDAEKADLSVSAVINQYTLSYQDAPEEDHKVPEVSKGVKDPFGTYSE
ncbi:MAG: hypothetical protein PUC40_01595 [Lachnospiraceae bacterium]|nr:hypothetical protein [Lachnospiraceae bacterium]MDY3990443.1 hypothetical protein [Lachnospiraceae bacterium]